MPVAAAAIADRLTPEGERALCDALGYFTSAHAPDTRHAYVAD